MVKGKEKKVEFAGLELSIASRISGGRKKHVKRKPGDDRVVSIVLTDEEACRLKAAAMAGGTPRGSLTEYVRALVSRHAQKLAGKNFSLSEQQTQVLSRFAGKGVG